MPAEEIHGIRDDERISLRHREYGPNAPAMNFDSLWCEFDHRIPVAYVDYKHENWVGPPDMKALKPLVWTADQCKRPAFVVRYASDFSWFELWPLNCLAEKYVKKTVAVVTEKRYVAFRYALAGRTCPPEIMERLQG